MPQKTSSLPPVLTRLGPVAVKNFMREYWQRKPLLIRQAFPDFSAPIGFDVMRALALRDDVESRLVTSFDGQWSMRHGPFAERGKAALPARTHAQWTLLVQGVDLYSADAARFLAQFRFVPYARLDDLMVSYASDGGGVGPHVDQYDVFLVQAQGRRRWRISTQRDLSLQPGLPLRILAKFRPTQEWILEPGDVLYLPPGVAHEGTAIGNDCITCSVGFRAPSWQELVQPWCELLMEQLKVQGRYADPGLQASARPGELPQAMVQATQQHLSRAPIPDEHAARVLLHWLSEPKSNVMFDPPARPLNEANFLRRAAQRGLQLDLRSRALYSGRGARFAGAINGELLHWPARAHAVFRSLADQRSLPGDTLQRLQAMPQALADLHGWYEAGWLQIG